MWKILYNFNNGVAFNDSFGIIMLKALTNTAIYWINLCIYREDRTALRSLSQSFNFSKAAGILKTGYSFVSSLIVFKADKIYLSQQSTDIFKMARFVTK